MSTCPVPHWDPASEAVQRDQIAAGDALREQRGVASSAMLGWSILRHAEVLRILLDPERFSSVVSAHVAVPNGMDPPEHTVYRHLIDPYFAAARVDSFRPECERIATTLVERQRGRTLVDLAADYALPFAVRVQCAFLGWPQELEPHLTDWIARHHRASLEQNRAALGGLGEQFQALVDGMLGERRISGAHPGRDVTASLMHARVRGELLTAQVIASILRNWTVGEIGTIAAAVGIVAEWLARQPGLQVRLRDEPALRSEAIDEILRLHGPLSANRRVAACPVEVDGQPMVAGERVTLHWPAANRDPRVFQAPDEFRWGRPPQDNLLYGAGIHVCPGAPLARMELEVALSTLLANVVELAPVAGEPAVRAKFPAMGFASLPMRLRWS